LKSTFLKLTFLKSTFLKSTFLKLTFLKSALKRSTEILRAENSSVMQPTYSENEKGANRKPLLSTSATSQGHNPRSATCCHKCGIDAINSLKVNAQNLCTFLSITNRT
jgi:hypothetical protein